jgi:glycosyltransferase involved in cell wall biosynthesis
VILRDVPHEAVMAAMARSLALVVPSVYPDACPTVAIEAMATARPVIASRMGGLPDLVEDGVTGFLLPARDVPALAEAMGRLASDSALRDRMGAAGRRKSRDFMVSSVVGRLEEAYSRSILRARTAA